MPPDVSRLAAATRLPAVQRKHAVGEHGSGSVLAVAVIAAVFLVSGLLIPVSLALAVKQRVEAAADAAALAAADTASGAVAGYPCIAARRAADLNGARLSSCSLDGPVVTVSTRSDYLVFVIVARARAGPPGS